MEFIYKLIKAFPLLFMVSAANALTCPDGQELKWYAGNAVDDLFSTAEAACEAYDVALAGRPTFYFVYSELNSNKLNHMCYHRSDTAQSPSSSPINLINTAVACGKSTKDNGCVGENGSPNPCNIATGNKFRLESDFESASLGLRRYYNSSDLSNVGLGKGWRTNYQKFLSISRDSIVKISGNGRGEPWRKINGVWRGDNDTDYVLTEDATGFELVKPNGAIEHYGPSGRIVSQIDTNGHATQYEYSAQTFFLNKVTNHYGQSISFTYERSRVASVTDAFGSLYKYEYDANDNLAAIVLPDNTANDADNPRKIYHYENPDFPNHLTGITDENGSRYGNFAYDHAGKAVLSELGVTSNPVGQEKIELNFEGVN